MVDNMQEFVSGQRKFDSFEDWTKFMSKVSPLMGELIHNEGSVSVEEALLSLADNEGFYGLLLDYRIVYEDHGKCLLSETYYDFFNSIFNFDFYPGNYLVAKYYDEFNNYIERYKVTKNENRKTRLLQQIGQLMVSIVHSIQRALLMLEINIENTYKTEDDIDLKIKILKDYIKDHDFILQVINDTRELIEKDYIFTGKIKKILDDQISYTFSYFNDFLKELVSILNQLNTYIFKFEKRSEFNLKLNRLYLLKDSLKLESHTNIVDYYLQDNPIWVGPRQRLATRISLDYLANSDDVLNIMKVIHREVGPNGKRKSRIAGPIDDFFLETHVSKERYIDHKKLFERFTYQGEDLFNFLLGYDFGYNVTEDDRILLYLQLYEEYMDSVTVESDQYYRFKNNLYLKIYARH